MQRSEDPSRRRWAKFVGAASEGLLPVRIHWFPMEGAAQETGGGQQGSRANGVAWRTLWFSRSRCDREVCFLKTP